jgi:hypothetical protein
MADRKQAPRIVDQPEPGRFKIRLRPGSPWSAARIWRVMGMLQAEIGYQSADVLFVWTHGERCTDAEYFRLRDHPAEAPDARVDIRTVNTF